MTDLNNEVRELPIDEMTNDQLDIVSAGNAVTTALLVGNWVKAYDAKFSQFYHLMQTTLK
jgi:hypothetical protein